MTKKFSFKKLLKMVLFLPLLPIIGIGGVDGAGTGAGEAGAGTDGKKPDETNSGGTDKGTADKTHSQADVDKAVQDRVAREQKKYQKVIDDMKKAMGGDTKTPAGTDVADVGAGVDPIAQEAVNKATAQMQVANQRLIQATALSEAIKLGVDPKYTADVVRLAEMSGVEVGEDGTMDTAAISKAIEEVIKRVPVFKMSADNAGGFKVGGEGQKAGSSPWGNTTKATSTDTGSNSKRWNRQNR